ncbi:MAG: helix-turn-helix transcriptional regulator [Thermodesulfobacteriota bacterium]
MITNREKKALIKRLQNKKHRDAFVSAIIDQTIPFQIRAMRLSKERNWTQKELARRASMKQERISMCENPNYGKLSLSTLKQLASAFDVGLIVRFVPFSDLVEIESNIDTGSLNPTSFDNDDYFKEKDAKGAAASLLHEQYSEEIVRQPNTDFSDVKTKFNFEQIKSVDYIRGDIHETAVGASG